MSCCTDASQTLASATLDPTKHVNYVLGMILGEDDFRQEFAYLSGRDQWLARDAIGYGTLRGLGVRVEMDGANGPRLYVEPGAALTPSGQLVCVPTPQCAHLNAWLAKHGDAVTRALASPPGDPLSLYVRLCYRTCETDKVPIPGEPCRAEDALVKPSRLQDDFALELSVDRPPQREEDALRDFCRWLKLIDMTDAGTPSVPLERLLDELRHAAAPWYSPPASPPLSDFLFGSPPDWLHVHPADAVAYLRAAFDLWVTELRPKWFARWLGCASEARAPANDEDCVCLAEVRVHLLEDAATGSFKAADSGLPEVIQTERPFVVHLRMLQEWLLSGLGQGAAEVPAAAMSVQAETTFAQRPSAGTAIEYARADHTHGTPTLPRLGGDIAGALSNVTVNRVRNVPVITAPAADNQVLVFQGAQWQPGTLTAASLPSLAGEVTGSVNNTTVAKVLGANVGPLAAALQNGQVLAFDSARAAWLPNTVSALGRFAGRADPAPFTLVAGGGFQFRMTIGTGAQIQVTNQFSGYNQLRALPAQATDPRDVLFFAFPRLEAPAAAERRYLVKLTPWSDPETKEPFSLLFAGFSVDAANQPRFAVQAIPPADTTGMIGRLMIEVSDLG